MFPCRSCGLCCQNITHIPELSSYDLGNGVCKHFDSIQNTCNIYTTRPNICRVETMFNLKYKEYFSKEAFYMENANVCNSLQKKYKLNESFRIKL